MADRAPLLDYALRLEYFTVGWNIIEGMIAIAAAIAAGSVALLGFGIDSFVETISGLILIWRLRAENNRMPSLEVERLDRRAHRLVGGSLSLLAAYIAFDAITTLLFHERPEPSWIGIAVTTVSMGVMWRLARSKRQAAIALGSRALEADSFQTTACWWLSMSALSGVGLNAFFGWWWADPAAALGMTYFLAKEGREAWRGNGCGC